MSLNSSIEWTDTTWNPIRGCSIVSPGCINCYAMKQAHRFSGPGKPYEGLTKRTSAGPQWTGDVREIVSVLNEPLKWKKPRRVFVNSMSDLFHESVSDEFILNVFTVMAVASHHTFQVLTKRPKRMLQLLSSWRADDIYLYWHGYSGGPAEVERWPLPNVQLGVSVENKDALWRIDDLKDTPAAIHMVSIEPLLEDLGALFLDGIEWVIVGGESGPGARPLRVAWVRSIVEQCRAQNVSPFVKQLGARPFGDESLCQFDSYEQWVNKARSWLGGLSGGGMKYKEPERAICVDRRGRVCRIGRDFMRARDEDTFPVTALAELTLSDRKGGDSDEWPADLRVRQFPVLV